MFSLMRWNQLQALHNGGANTRDKYQSDSVLLTDQPAFKEQ